MTRDGLKRFHINTRRSSQCDISVSEGMRCCSVKVNCPVYPLPHPCKGSLCHRREPIAHNEPRNLAIRTQNIHQAFIKRNGSYARVAFRLSQHRLIVEKSHRLFDMDDPTLPIKVLPSKTQRLPLVERPYIAKWQAVFCPLPPAGTTYP